MTDLSRGARARRGGRRPGWMLLTALLVLAIGASSALVFTNQVKLLKLAVVLALWAAVVAAFVSVIYRRQSDVDQARARDLKLVYDLQLDREISARREYELTVESQLRRELSTELRAQDTDEVAALRAELAALRTNLEILFDAELSDRPALETERKTVRGYSEWDREGESARERVNRVASVRPEESSRRADDRSIIDVHEEPLVPAPPRQRTGDSYQPAYGYQPAEAYASPRPTRATEVTHQVSEQERGIQWRQGQETRAARDEVAAPGGWAAPGPPPAAGSSATNTAERQPDSRGWAPQDRPSQTGGRAATGAWVAEPAGEPERFEPPPPRRSHRRPEPPTPPEPQFVPPPPPPEPQFVPPPVPPPQQPRPGWSPPPEEPRRQEQPAWQPVTSEGQWLPAGAPGSQWNSGQGDSADAAPHSKPSQRSPSAGDPVPASPPPVERRGRHSSAMAESAPNQIGEHAPEWSEPGRRARARHSTEYPDLGIAGSETPAPAMSPPPTPPPPPPPSPPDRGPVMTPPPPPNARHRGTDPHSAADHPPTGGQSVAELLARLQTTPAEGGRRRRRED
jgi:hypothetical protein